MKLKLLLSTALIATFFVACNGKTTPGNGGGGGVTDSTVAPDFTFNTVQENVINLNLIDMQGVAIPNIKISIYGQDPIDQTNGTYLKNVDTLATAQTDAGGLVSFLITTSNTTQNIYAVTSLFGYVNPTVIRLNSNGTTNQTITPAGYVVSKRMFDRSSISQSIAKVTNTQSVNVQLLRNNIYTMSGWDNNGVPAYQTTVKDVIPTSINVMLSATLPEGSWEPTLHPEFFTNPQSANINIIEDAQVWVTFVSEGAGYTSSMGYFTYPTVTPPTSASQISQMYIIYPNCSLPGSGGNLSAGTKVELVVSDGNGGYTDRIPAGTSIGWFLMSNSYSGSSKTIGPGSWTLYSFDKFNPGGKQQTIVLNDPADKLNFISFEDISFTNSSCDGDSNDVIFYCTASPYTAINQTGIPIIIPPKDTDGDGVIDSNDAYPNDPTLAYDSYYPAKNVFGTMAYEDLWPYTGDYDFNDLVVDFNFHQQLNAQNKVVNVLPTLKLRAVGSSFHNGLALGFNTTKGNIRSVSGTQLTGSVYSIGANGAETGNSNAVIPIFTDGFTLFGNRPYTNTVIGKPYMNPVTLNVTINLATPVAQSSLGAAPYDLFMVINQTRGNEVHLMNHAPTSLANVVQLGTGNDKSNPSKAKYYVAGNGRPWVIQFPTSFVYPIEKGNISNAYSHFNAWAASGGTSYPDWYSNNAGGYRNNSVIYTH